MKKAELMAVWGETGHARNAAMYLQRRYTNDWNPVLISTPPGVKGPRTAGWDLLTPTEKDIAGWDDHCGLMLLGDRGPVRILCIDGDTHDPSKNGRGFLEDWEDSEGAIEGWRMETPSGGIHIYVPYVESVMGPVPAGGIHFPEIGVDFLFRTMIYGSYAGGSYRWLPGCDPEQIVWEDLETGAWNQSLINRTKAFFDYARQAEEERKEARKILTGVQNERGGGKVSTGTIRIGERAVTLIADAGRII